ncbi:MAG: major capsid protein [Undibacterium sp.]|uniref:major capsid protein n=1 Tax=Undibacterium sp. TaxID=1914977 RepID=UPI0027187CC2|nr:major capsid protein [Undibacterium sp.]MDO8652076.1 major capsid protein [Undibacterium sp.]
MKKFTALRLAAISATLAIATGAQAALPAAATTAITDAGTDMLAAVGAVIASMVAVWGLRKLGSKMGWM